ncbi:MAG: hypothetical protein GDA65_06990 [Nitrospira sp. CR1.1]|jgi:hypothetical protein|nr:hypothetical protein [Nitrospira sp. CR1.1]
MDQRTAAINQDLKDIVDTRSDIARKLELLEQRIKDTAEGATMKVSRLLDEGSQSVTQLVDKTTAALNPVQKVDAYPWLMLGGAMCAGYAIGLLEARTRAPGRGVYAYYPPGAHASRIMPEPEGKQKKTARRAEGIYDYYPDPQRARRTERQSRPGIWETMSRELGADTDQAKAALMQAGCSLMVEFASKLIPEIARSFGVILPSQGKPGKNAREPYGKPPHSESTAGRGARPSGGAASPFS